MTRNSNFSEHALSDVEPALKFILVTITMVHARYSKHKLAFKWLRQSTTNVEHSETDIILQWNLWIADTYGTEKECPLLGGVRYSEVNLEGFHRIGSQILCPLLGGVRYSACPPFRGFTVISQMFQQVGRWQVQATTPRL